jgi:hypothetical protein
MQQLVGDEGGNETSNTSFSTRIHRDVKKNLPLVIGEWHKVTKARGKLLDSDIWTIAVFNLESPAQMESLQTYLDNLSFYDSSYKLQIFNSNDQYVFAIGSSVAIDKLLNEMGKDVNNQSSS